MKLKLLLFGSLVLTTQLFAQKWREMSEDPTSNYYDVKDEGETYYNTHERGKGSGYKQFQRWLFYMKNHIDEKGNQINIDVTFNRNQEANARLRKNARVQATGADWKEVGPTYWTNSGGWAPGLGRLEAVRVDGLNQNNIYVGSPGGGAWKTTDGGTTWKPITDKISASALFVWAIGLADGSPDSVYVGTQSGILYSYNGGASFKIASGIPSNTTVRRIEVHPTKHNIILAATNGGIFKSINYGQSWTSVKTGSTLDLRFKPDNSNIIYAVGTSFSKSTDGGNTFTNVTMGAGGTKRLAVTAAKPNYVYVAELSGQAFGAMYRSEDAGVTFTKRVTGGQAGTKYGGYNPDGNDDAGQGSYNFCLAASPINPEEIHLGCIITWKSTNGGSSFTATTMWTYPNNTGYTHCDMHQLEYVGNTLYTGSDGGIFKSTNQGGDFTDISKGLGIRMYYKIAQAESNLTMVGGGAQDNGGNLYKNGKWIDWFSADGMNTVIDWSNPNIIYGMSQNGTLYKSTNGGTSTTSITQPGAGAWVNPLAQDTKVASTIYYGGTAGLYKSTNSGSSWTNIYSALGQLVEIEVSPADNNYVYISKGSTIHVSMNAGASFVNASTGLSGTVEQIAPSPLDAKKVYAATSSGVFMSVNAGANWTNITGSLPAGGAAAIAVDNTTDEGVYAAIGYTVYYKNKNLAWIPFSDNLPFVDIRQLEYHKLSKKVRVGTYGRGIWESGAFNPIESVPTVKFSESTKSGCGLVKVTFTDESTDNVTSRKWSFPGGNPSTSTASIVTVTYSTKGLYSVTLEATNSTGSSNLVKKDIISVDKVDAPVTKDIFFCPDSKPALLTATKTAGTINWYSEKDTLNKIASGDSYTAPISVTTKYFVNAINGSPQATVGPVDTKIGANSTHAGGQHLVFTAFKAFDLLSVKMIATGTKDRTITLKDAEGNLIDSKTVSVPDGESVVKLNWSIPAGIDMQLGVNAGADLVRNSVGGVYPYSVANLVSITGNSAGAGYEAYYYYFYDWKIQEKGVCASKMVPVTATLNCVTATDNNLVNVSDIIYPNPVHNELSFKMNGTIKLAFYSVDGKLVKETILLNSERMMDVSNLANGIYTLVVENEGKKIITKLAKK